MTHIMGFFFLSTKLPGDSIAIELKELEQILSLFAITGFLLGRQGIIGHQQRMGTTP